MVAAMLRGAMTQFAQFWLAEGGIEVGRPVPDDEVVETLTSFL